MQEKVLLKRIKVLGLLAKKTQEEFSLNGVATSAFVDADAMCSFISLQLVQENQWAIKPCKGTICQAISGSEMSRIH